MLVDLSIILYSNFFWSIAIQSKIPLQSPNIHAGMTAWLVARGNKIKDPAASNGVFDPRGSRQISMQAWLLGSLLAVIMQSTPKSSLYNTV